MAMGFNPHGVWRPRGRGFSMGVVQHEGRVIHFTGQVGWDENDVIAGKNDVRAQMRQVFRNIERILAAVGGTLDDLVAVTTYFVDRAHLPAIQEVRSEFLAAENAPTSTSIMVAGLGHEEFLVELTPVAVVPERRFIVPSRL